MPINFCFVIQSRLKHLNKNTASREAIIVLLFVKKDSIQIKVHHISLYATYRQRHVKSLVIHTIQQVNVIGRDCDV